MKINTLVILAAAVLSIPSTASAQDRSNENRAAVRRMFPIVTLFDKKKPAPAEQATPQVTSSTTDNIPAGNALATMNTLATSPGDNRDVAGIRLGMTPAQARAAASNAGYSPSGSKTQYSWASIVREEEGFRGLTKLHPASADQVLGTEEYRGPGTQKLTVSYTPTPQGVFVYSVRYSVNMSETPWDTMKERTRAKYGREGYATASQLSFCMRDEKRCDAFGQYQRPNIELDFMPGTNWLTLQQGLQYRNAYTAARNAEVDRLHPKNERPAF